MNTTLVAIILDRGLALVAAGFEREAVKALVAEQEAKGATIEQIADHLGVVLDQAIASNRAKVNK